MKEKQKYIVPAIEKIELDSEISLALESILPPIGPDESLSTIKIPEYFNNEPYKLC